MRTNLGLLIIYNKHDFQPFDLNAEQEECYGMKHFFETKHKWENQDQRPTDAERPIVKCNSTVIEPILKGTLFVYSLTQSF